MILFTLIILINSNFISTDIEKKKISSEQKKRLNTIEDNIHSFMESSIDSIHTPFAPLQKSISPLIEKLQPHLDMFPDKMKDECKLVDQGFVNYNLCLNAQTEQSHTECDASYTVITVPNQLQKTVCKEKKNKGIFELNLNETNTLIIPMNVGTSFVYSGFLLSHHQQIQNLNDDTHPFVNIVSYNSKRLFENMLQSFRRYLGDDFE